MKGMFWSRNKNRNVVGDRKMIMEQLTKEDKMYYITKIMLELGMPVHLSGYHYLREAIRLSMENMELIEIIITEIVIGINTLFDLQKNM